MFVGIGIAHDTAEAFRHAMQDTGALAHTVMFLNLASEPSTQRLLTPRFALTAAEYLAAEEDRHVLIIMTDMTNYCEALREVSASHGEVPSRKGYPGYMYSDLASIYERAGRSSIANTWSSPIGSSGEVTPTRSTALDLADELRLMRQGYEFLDEKRMLLIRRSPKCLKSN